MGARRVAIAVVAAVVGTGALVGCHPAAPTGTQPGRGAYLGPLDAERVEAFSDWAGPPATTHVSSFIPQGQPGTRGFLEIDGWITQRLPEVRDAGRQLVLSVPLVPTGSTFASVIEGDGHRRLTKLAAALRAAGHGRTVIRLGWESNGEWFRWFADDDPVGYRRAFRTVVRTLRAAAPGLRFEWNVVCKPLPESVAWYPGHHYVDIVGQDCYARNPSVRDPWGQWRRALESVADFARARGKRLAISEWGTSLDDAGLVRSFLRWAQTNSVAYHIYWDVEPMPGEADTRLAGQPNASRAYLENGA